MRCLSVCVPPYRILPLTLYVVKISEYASIVILWMVPNQNDREEA